MMNSGVPTSTPSMAPDPYGLGSDADNLPATSCSPPDAAPPAASPTDQRIPPSNYQGVPSATKASPYCTRQPLDAPRMPAPRLDTVRDLNQIHYEDPRPEILARISHELAYRMQAAAPELIDSPASPRPPDMYGVDRPDPATKPPARMVPAPSPPSETASSPAGSSSAACASSISTHASWDHHSDLDNEMEYTTAMCDQPIAALIKDLKQRGLLDETLVIFGSESAAPSEKTAPVSAKPTPDETTPMAFTIWMATADQGGTIIGETDDIGWNIVRTPSTSTTSTPPSSTSWPQPPRPHLPLQRTTSASPMSLETSPPNYT